MPSSSVIIDSNELRQFAAHLKRFNQELDASSKRLHGHFRQLGDTWRDPAYHKFSGEFDQILRNLERFRRISDEVVPHLLQTADRVDAVHGR